MYKNEKIFDCVCNDDICTIKSAAVVLVMYVSALVLVLG